MENTSIYRALQGVRGRQAVDLEALEQLLVRFSQMVAEQPAIASIDINPLLASPSGLLALDARVILRDPTTPSPRLGIRPYPTQYVWPGHDGITIRPIRPEDEPLIIAFHETVSDYSIYLRYFHTIKHSTRIAHDRLTRICFNDYDREIALVAEAPDSKIIGVCRLTQKHGLPEAEFAMLVADPYQGQGFGTELLSRLIEIARAEGLTRLTGEILAENNGMQHLCRRVGFQLKPTGEPGILAATLDLTF